LCVCEEVESAEWDKKKNKKFTKNEKMCKMKYIQYVFVRKKGSQRFTHINLMCLQSTESENRNNKFFIVLSQGK
jgi:hypothetical protein